MMELRSMTVQYRPTTRRWYAWLGPTHYWFRPLDCCVGGHKTLRAAAQHGGQILVRSAIAVWVDTAANEPESWAREVLGRPA